VPIGEFLPAAVLMIRSMPRQPSSSSFVRQPAVMPGGSLPSLNRSSSTSGVAVVAIV
jgi:hypothetical protein